MNDDEIRKVLKKIDHDETVDVNEWEADFIESVVYNYRSGPLSKRQRDRAKAIIEKYER